jgi:hypothetical protein
VLQRVENVTVYHDRGFMGSFTGNGRVVVTVGRKQFRVAQKSHKTEFARLWQLSATHPVCFVRVGERTYWRLDSRWFWDNEGLTANEVYAVIATRDQRRKESINRAQSTVAMAVKPTPQVRGAISEDVKQLVWTRDQGKCRQCGSNAELQYDHIIPWSMGGASSPENIQILCGPCNRRKGASVASPNRPGPTL